MKQAQFFLQNLQKLFNKSMKLVKGQFYACIRKQQIQIDDLRVQSELMEQQIERLTERTQGDLFFP